MAKTLLNCEVISMSSKSNYKFIGDYDRIGFVYPTYFLGMPLRVKEFISHLNFPDSKSVYYFGVTTCGSLA
jgi:multimeric flavodoxin WrbA